MRSILPRTRAARIATALVAATVVAVPVGAVVATSSSAQIDASAGSSTAVVTNAARQVKVSPTKLLTAADLPTGWLRYTPSAADKSRLEVKAKALLAGATVTPASCVPSMDSHPGYQGNAHRLFRKGTSQLSPHLGQVVAVFDSVQAARAAMTKARQVAAACSNVTVSSSEGGADVKVSSMTAPALGDERVAYEVDALVGGMIPVHGQIVIVREGREITVIGQAGMVVSTSTTLSAATKAAARL